MDLLPALSIYPDTNLSEALDLSYERSYSYLPVVSRNKRLLGYLTAEQLQNSTARPSDKVKEHYVRFRKGAGSREYRKITPNTPLEDLEAFFKSGEEFAVITDDERRFVLGVATKEDLDKFVQARPQIS